MTRYEQLLALVEDDGGGQAAPAVRRAAPAQLPQARRELPCLHLGSATGEDRECPTCNGSVRLKLFACAVHGQATIAKPVEGVATCATCENHMPVVDGMVTIDHGGNGVGDALLGLLAVSGFKREHPGVRVRYNVGAMQWPALFHGYDELGKHAKDHNTQPVPGAGQLNLGWDHEWNSKFRDSAMWERYCRNIGTRTWHLPELREPERLKALGAPYAGAVVLCPYSLWTGRNWTLEYWLELERLLRADGYRTIVAHSKPDGCERFASELACGLPADRVAGIFLNASLIVSVESGPAHLGGILRRPTLVMCGGYPGERIYGAYPYVTPIDGGSMGAITPERVHVEVRRACPPAVRPKDEPDSLNALLALIETKLGNHQTQWGRADRDRTMGWLFRELYARFPDPQIVETGCVRQREDWGAGYATWLFGAFLDIINAGQLASVDNDAKHCETARELCRRWSRVQVIESDSVAYLQARTGPVDLAYLDSLDCYVNGHAEHGLREAQAVERLVSPRGFIVFDDTPYSVEGWKGKGRLAVPWLCDHGWRVLPISSYQTILERA